METLLNTDGLSKDNPALSKDYNHQTILITGAAGSIGSEIARKIGNYTYKKLILLDIAESPLYELQQEFLQNGTKNFVAVISDVRDFRQMEKIFEQHKPTMVFHAAAYKHVPLMEDHPAQAVHINIGGTRNMASLSIKHGVNKFVLISTDKAVNPASVMGATKRIAELYLNSLKGTGQTKFMTTRFGNVLGSNGSIIPLFKKQIAHGGPITVTHKAMTRYFITISQACQLVLEAAAMGNGGELFVFDMGKPVNIYDLAKKTITLFGLRFPEDINIEIIGLRPGEKLCEELLADGENTKPTHHKKIKIATTKSVDALTISDKISNLCKAIITAQDLELVAMIKDIVPEYTSSNSKYEVLDSEKIKTTK